MSYNRLYLTDNQALFVKEVLQNNLHDVGEISLTEKERLNLLKKLDDI